MSRARRVDLALAALQDEALRAIDKPLGRYQLQMLERDMNDAVSHILGNNNAGEHVDGGGHGAMDNKSFSQGCARVNAILARTAERWDKHWDTAKADS
jgi:hypothetical protein